MKRFHILYAIDGGNKRKGKRSWASRRRIALYLFRCLWQDERIKVLSGFALLLMMVDIALYKTAHEPLTCKEIDDFIVTNPQAATIPMVPICDSIPLK